MEVPGDFAIGIREMGGVGGGCDGNGITEAARDVVGPEAHCEQAEGGHQATAVHTEQLVLVGDSHRSSRANTVLMPAMRSTTTLRSAEQFPSEPVTRARYLPPAPYFFFSARTVDPGYFVSRAKAALSMSESILPARCATVQPRSQGL